jgi:hypothetical protein
MTRLHPAKSCYYLENTIQALIWTDNSKLTQFRSGRVCLPLWSRYLWWEHLKLLVCLPNADKFSENISLELQIRVWRPLTWKCNTFLTGKCGYDKFLSDGTELFLFLIAHDQHKRLSSCMAFQISLHIDTACLSVHTDIIRCKQNWYYIALLLWLHTYFTQYCKIIIHKPPLSHTPTSCAA